MTRVWYPSPLLGGNTLSHLHPPYQPCCHQGVGRWPSSCCCPSTGAASTLSLSFGSPTMLFNPFQTALSSFPRQQESELCDPPWGLIPRDTSAIRFQIQERGRVTEQLHPYSILFFFLHPYWSIIALQCYVSFCCITKWISHTYTYIPISPPSCVSLPPSLSHPSR